MNDSRGFTLVELVISVSIFMVLMLAAVTLYTTTLKTYLKDKITQDLQRENDAVLAHMTQNLREAVSVDTANSNFTANPNTLTVKLKTTGQSRKYYVTGNQLHYINEAGTDTNLLGPGTTATSLTMTPTSDANSTLKSVKIRGTLSRTKNSLTSTLDLASSVSVRPQ